MTHNNDLVLFVLVAVLGTIFLVTVGQNAYAHFSFDIKPGANVNQTVRITLGETTEPAYPDEIHNLEVTLVHRFTNLRVGGAHLSQTNPTTQKMFVDAYFYPASALVTSGGAPSISGGVPAMSCSGGSDAGDPFNCVPGAGYTDSRMSMSLSPISVNEGGAAGQYRQATRQLYTEQGRTLYHIYGEINYFNDTGIGPVPINIWTDGANVKKASWCEGLAANKASCVGGDTTYNKTLPGSVSGGFGLGNRTSIYWPGSAAGITEDTHPSNIRKAIGSIRDNTFDIWNFLEQISNGLNTITEFTPKIPDYVPRNSTNSGAPSSYTFP